MQAWLAFLLIPSRGDAITSVVSSSISWQCCLVISSLQLRLPFIQPHQVPSWKSQLCYSWFLVFSELEWSCWPGNPVLLESGSRDQTSQQCHRVMTRGLAWMLPWIIPHLCQICSKRWLAPPPLSGSQPLGECFQWNHIIPFEGNIPVHWLFGLRIQLLLLDPLPSKSYGR